MCKNCKKCEMPKCFPDSKTIIKCCCCCNFTYYKLFVLQTIFAMFFYFFDIGSDIFVLVDLKNNNSEYFTLCLVIILLPVIVTTINVTRKIRLIRRELNCKTICLIILNFILYAILHIGFLSSVFFSIKNKRKTDEFVDIRLRESILESAPESLFQLFITLKNISTYTYNQLLIYYLSISASLLSLIASLISYELYNVNDINKCIYTINARDIRMAEKRRAKGEQMTEAVQEIKIIYGDKIQLFSPYIFLLVFYRITEVLSRIGLLSCIGNIYNGYAIIWFLLSDFTFSVILHSFYSVVNCDFIHYDENEEGRNINVFTTIIKILFQLVERLKELPVYPEKFLLYDETNRSSVERNYHFISRIINNTVSCVLVTYNISKYTYSYSLTVISIGSICMFILNIPTLCLILWYSKEQSRYIPKLRNISIYCINCNINCISCCNKKNKSNRNMEESADLEAIETVKF